MSGGASFTPRLDPRPEPLPHLQVARSALVYHVRVPLLCALVLFSIWPVYERISTELVARRLSERAFFVIMSTSIHVILHWSHCGLTLYWHNHGYFERYRIPRMTREIPKSKLIDETVKEAIVSQLVAEPVLLYLIFPLYERCGVPSFAAPLPEFSSAFLSFVIAYACNDWAFYWSHRAMHAKRFYKLIHKQHHSYSGTIGLAAEFASPVEQALAAKAPTAMGCVISGAHPAIWLVWMSYRLIQTYEAHSGYCFYGSLLHRIGLTNSESAAFHDFHHTGNRGNFGFGPPSYLDHCFGTMDAWLALGGIEGYLEQCRKRAAQGAGKGK
jgi:sterol desaturase/sphingolipid hydroxylase (fatty acid hydroxylase superfamily)